MPAHYGIFSEIEGESMQVYACRMSLDALHPRSALKTVAAASGDGFVLRDGEPA